jgi:MFS family permease
MDGLARPPTAEGEQASYDDDMRWGVPFRAALRSRAFWMLGIAQAAFFFVWTVVIVYQIPYMEAQGISRPAAAGLGAGALSFAALVSRLLVGRYADQVGRRRVLLVSFVLMTATIPLLLLIENILVGMAILAVIGATASAGSPLRTSLIADYYGIRNFGAINGISMFVGTVGALVGPAIVGWLFDTTGEYTAGWLLTTAVAAISIPAIIAARPPHALMERYQAEARAHSRAPRVTAPRPASTEAQPASSGPSGTG